MFIFVSFVLIQQKSHTTEVDRVRVAAVSKKMKKVLVWALITRRVSAIPVHRQHTQPMRSVVAMCIFAMVISIVRQTKVIKIREHASTIATAITLIKSIIRVVVVTVMIRAHIAVLLARSSKCHSNVPYSHTFCQFI